MVTARPPTVLCIDNEADALSLRQKLLEQAGYRVLSATTAVAAFKLFKSQTVDLVIFDHLLPDLTGAEMTRTMKGERPFVPVMLFSAVPDAPPGSEHADLFVNKADGPAAFLLKVADLLRHNRITEGNFFAEIRCDKRFSPAVWHYTVQRLRSKEILGWSQALSEEAAIDAARTDMRERGREESRKNCITSGI
jgi:two-component system, OmpR family, response regulator CpxR